MDQNIRARRILRRQSGFSLVEMLVAISVAGILSTMAVFQFNQAQPYFKGDGAMRVLMAQVMSAQQLAIAERRNMRLTFTNTNQVNIVREEVAGPNPTTTISSVPFEGGVTFGLVAGLPDSPDAFGNAAAVNFGVAAQVKFGTEGMLIDQNGQPLNGSVFISVPGLARSARVMTVFGATGRIRAYRWDGGKWVLV